MVFSIDPPSGYTNSFMNIKFNLEFDDKVNAEIEFFNQTTDEQLDILAVSSGYIRNGRTIIVQGNSAEGYFNLFNNDDMNVNLKFFAAIDLSCKAIIQYTSGKREEYSEDVVFYNEGASVDSDIIPFDLKIHNQHVKNHIPLSLTLISGEENRYELSIRSDDDKNTCVFEVVCRSGITNVEVPLEYLSYELDLSRSFNKNFQIYYTKFQGITPSGYHNRSFIPIKDSAIQFSSKRFMPQPQTRQGPIGTLSKDFLLSDIYFVHTFKSYTSYGKQMEEIKSICNLPRFIHEVQDVQSPQHFRKQSVKQESNIRSLKEEALGSESNRFFRYINPDMRKKKFLNEIAGTFLWKPQRNMTKSQSKIRSGCKGCGRKKHG